MNRRIIGKRFVFEISILTLMVAGVGGLGLVGLAVCGCSKKQPLEAETTPAVAQVAPSTQPSNGTATPPQGMWQPEAIAQSDGQADLKALNRCLVRWLIANKRRPKDFEDFAATAGMPIPPPPEGKRYVIGKDMHVALVSR